MKTRQMIPIALFIIAMPLLAQTVAPSSNAKTPASVTHLRRSEQAWLDKLRATADASLDVRPVQAEIDTIVKNHPGYHWEDHGILSDKSGLMPNTKPLPKPIRK